MGLAARWSAAWSANREYVGSCGQAAPQLEMVDAPLDAVVLFVGIRIEVGRAPTLAAPAQTVADLVRGVQEDRANLSPAQVVADRAG